MTQSRVRTLHHDHIDGSVAVLDVLDDLHRYAPKGSVLRTADQIREHIKDPHANIVEKFGAVTGLLQTEESLKCIGYAYGRRRHQEGYAYVEAKFAPQYHANCEWNPFRAICKLTLEQAVQAMVSGLWLAERAHDIRILPHLCIGREATAEFGMEIARIALAYDGAVALDLACNEAGFPPERHAKAYAMTLGTKVKRDCHTGEWVDPNPSATYRARLLQNVRTAVRELRCDGISHAIPLADDPELVREVADRGIRVALCPLSNKTLGGIADVRDLRIRALMQTGVKVTLNADDDLFLPTMDEVVAECDAAYRFTDDEWEELTANGIETAFATDVR